MVDTAFRFALITRDEKLRETVSGVLDDPSRARELAQDVRASAGDLTSEQMDALYASDAQVIVLDLGDEAASGLRILHAIGDALPGRPLIVAGPAVDADALLAIVRAGATEYLPKPVTSPDVGGAVARATRKVRVLRTEDVRPAGRVYTVFSAKGGAGVTTFATNVAVQFAVLSHRKTLLLDLNRELGTAPISMAVHPRYTFIDVIRNFHRMDDELLVSYLERHESGAFVLGSPNRPDDADALTPEHIRALLRFLRHHFEFVVVDLGHAFSSLRGAVLEESDQCVLVTTPELPTLRNTKNLLTIHGGSAGSGSDKMKLVLNRFVSDGEITIPQVEQALGVKVDATLTRDDERVIHSLNAGRPIVLNGRSRYSKDIKALSAELLGPQFRNGSARGVRGALASALSPLSFGRSKTSKTSADEQDDNV